MLEKQWTEKNINISSELAPITYAGDEHLLQQVWINILSNAIKYTPSNGEIDITLFEKGGKKVVQIADTGIGIAAEDVPKIFDRKHKGGQRFGACHLQAHS
jgi:signal transduction histidine kinase